jgi:uncharacterized membrane protein
MLSVLIVMYGLMAGVYFTFSVFVMRSLATLNPLNGARAMIAINEIIVKTLFLPIFFGSTVLSVVLMTQVFLSENSNDAGLIYLASCIYIVGMFLVTILGNIPMNNQLRDSAANNQQLSAYWQYYLIAWTRLNHIRFLSCTIAMMLLCLLK